MRVLATLLLLLTLPAFAAEGVTWESQVSLGLDGHVQPIRRYRVTRDAHGHETRVLLEREKVELTPDLAALFAPGGLLEQADAYAALACDPGFLSRAHATPGKGSEVHHTASSVRLPGDQVRLLTKGGEAASMEVSTAWQSSPATLEVTFGAGGVPVLILANVPDLFQGLVVENSGFRKGP